MAYTLQRKMFKMGGVAHGGGVTSGLKLNKGGSVQEPQATFGVGNNANKTIGPDGKVREANFAFLPMIAGPTMALGRAGLMALRSPGLRTGASRGLEALKQFIQTGRTGALKVGDIASRPTAKQIARMTPEQIKRTVGKAGFGPAGRFSQIGRGAGLAGTLAGAGVGLPMALSDRVGLTEKGNEDSRLESLTRGIGQTALDLGSVPGIATGALQYLRGTEKDPKETSLYNLLSGNRKDKLGNISDEDTKTDFGDVIKEEEKTQAENSAEALAGLKDRSEAYLKLLNDEQGSNRLGDVGLAISAAAPGLLAEDYGQAASAYGQTLGGRLDAERAQERELSLAAKQLAIGDMQKEEERAYQQKAGMEQLMTAALLEGDPTTQIKAQKLLNIVSEIGIENITELPVKANGKIDEGKMKRSMVYTDVDKLSGKTFVSINKNGQPAYSDNFLEAQQHASS